MPWCFAVVNNRLAEIYFKNVKGKPHIFGHCYVNQKDYKTKREQKWILEDTAKYRLIYRTGRYKAVSSILRRSPITQHYNAGH